MEVNNFSIPSEILYSIFINLELNNAYHTPSG